ncbi:MAG TPA: hypothetical protein VGR76_07090, partial [Candidatus Angelobacter sp.]|nr:hypothetical protein [Candidatus Angelobacter sp.]
SAAEHFHQASSATNYALRFCIFIYSPRLHNCGCNYWLAGLPRLGTSFSSQLDHMWVWLE